MLICRTLYFYYFNTRTESLHDVFDYNSLLNYYLHEKNLGSLSYGAMFYLAELLMEKAAVMIKGII